MKKIIAVILSIALISGALSIASSAFDAKKITPVILVSGLGAREYYKNYNTPDEYTVFPPAVNFKAVAKTSLDYIAKYTLTGDKENLSLMVADILDSVFEQLKCDENGDAKYPDVYTPTYPLSVDNYDFNYSEDVPEVAIIGSLIDEIGAENIYFYNYDWRLDPIENSADLKQYIERAKEQTGSQKVTLVPCSMGGVQTMAYISQYGYDDIEKIVFMSSAHKGLVFVSELFKGNAYIEQKELFTFLSRFLHIGDESTDSAVDFLFGICANSPYLKPVFDLLNGFARDITDEAVYDGLRRTIAGWPGMWSFVCSEDYDEARAFMTNEATSEKFLEKIDNYHNAVGKNIDSTLLEMNQNGVSVAVCSHYDRGIIPATTKSYCEGDYLIETVSTSNGATVAKANEVFPDGYIQSADDGHNHLSCDKKIDASTCLFPDYTWFIKGMEHVGCPYKSEYGELALWLITFDGQPTVYDNEKYPQFLQTDYTQMKLEPLAPQSESTDLFAVIKLIFQFFVNIFNSITSSH